MESNAAAKVGLMVLIGIGLFIGGWWFLSHGLYNVNHYPLHVVFKDTKGLLKQTPVRMNGVTIGEVADVKLLSDLTPEQLAAAPGKLRNAMSDQGLRLRPVVVLQIDKSYAGKIPDDSYIVITSGILISNPMVDITPGRSETAYAKGEFWRPENVREPAGLLAQVSPEASEAVHRLSVVLQDMTPQLKRVKGILTRTEQTVANLQEATASAKSLIADPKIRRTLHASLDDLGAISHELRLTSFELSRDMRAIVKRNGPKFDELAHGAVDLLQKLGDTVDAARSAVTRLTETVSDPRLQQSLLETLDLAKATVARFNQIASDIHQLTGDPGVQNDLKTSVANLRETAEQIKPLVEKISTLVEAIKPGGRPKLGIGKPSLAIDVMARGDAPHFRSDVSVRLPIGERNAFNAGLFDFAERNKLIAQYETGLTGNTALRYGIYASKLGLGFDWQPSSTGKLVLDAYDPNNFQVNARALFRINNDFSLWGGVDSVFKRTTPVLGLRLTR